MCVCVCFMFIVAEEYYYIKACFCNQNLLFILYDKMQLINKKINV